VTGPPRPGADAGTATLFILGLAVALLAFTGLAVDGGLAFALRREAANIAEEATRAGVQQVDQVALREGKITVDPARAEAAALARANTLIADSGYTGRADGATCAALRCTIQVRLERDTALLGLVGKPHMTASVQRSTRLAVGIEREDQ